MQGSDVRLVYGAAREPMKERKSTVDGDRSSNTERASCAAPSLIPLITTVLASALGAIVSRGFSLLLAAGPAALRRRSFC